MAFKILIRIKSAFLLFLIASTGCATRFSESDFKYRKKNVNLQPEIRGHLVIKNKRFELDALILEQILFTFEKNNSHFIEDANDKTFEFIFNGCNTKPSFPSTAYTSINYLVLVGTLGLFPIKNTITCETELAVYKTEADVVKYHDSYTVTFEERWQLFMLFGMSNSDDIGFSVGVPVKHLMEKYNKSIQSSNLNHDNSR